MSSQATPTSNSSNLLRGVSAFSLMTFISRVLGLARDMVIANVFGASAATDAFWLAFKIPNFFRRLFAEGSFVQAFVPVLADYQQESVQSQRDFIANVMGSLALLLTVLTLLVMLTAPWLLHVLAPGFDNSGARYALATDMLRITFPYIIFIALTALMAAVLNSHKKFAAAAFTPVLLNLCLITTALFLAPQLAHGIVALAWGVCAAGILQLCFVCFFVFRVNLLVWPKWGWQHSGVRRVIRLMLPTLVGSSASQINLLVDNLLATLLPIGSVSWLYYADRLNQFPLGLLGVAIGTVVLPQLSADFVAKQQQRFSENIIWGLRLSLLLGVPAAVALFILAKPLLTSLFNYGQFTTVDVVMAAKALQAFALGLPAFMLSRVWTAVFYAQKDTKTPLRIALIAIGTNLILSLLLYKPFAHVGLAAATSFSAWLSVFLLAGSSSQFLQVPAMISWKIFGLRVFIAALALGIILYLVSSGLSWFDWSAWARISHLLVIVVAGIIAYFSTLLLVGWRWAEVKSPR